MKGIGALLERFKKLAPPDDLVRSETVRILQSIAGVEVEKKDVVVKKFVVWVTCDPLTKGEIFMHKRQLLKSLTESFGKKAPVDIR